MIILRKSADRGHADHGWLDSHHTFSFADYYDPKFMGFRSLRVINEDRVAGGGGFPTHPHRDMEIVTYVIEGSLKHVDSMGNGSVLNAGDIQCMSAGTGVRHSEFNASHTEPVHFLQIWIQPHSQNLPAKYQEKSKVEYGSGLHLLVSPDGREGTAVIQQDVSIYLGTLAAGDKKMFQVEKGRFGWVQLFEGQFAVGDLVLSAGDGASLSEETQLEFSANTASKFLLFDLN